MVKVRDFGRHADLSTTQGYVHAIESPDDAEIYAVMLSAEATARARPLGWRDQRASTVATRRR